jgi:Dolichyl-phosphate-mannose-protein mannosyltransferase
MPVLDFAVASGLVALTSAVVVRELSLADGLDRVLAFFTLGLAQVVASLLIAGAALSRLAPGAILLVNAAALAAGLAVSIMRGRRTLETVIPPAPRLAELTARARDCVDRWVLVLALLALGEVIWRLLIAYALPPLGFDALWYHLTTVAGWVQAGRISRSPLSLWSAVYPENGELFFAWPSVFLRSDTIVDSVQLGFAIIAAVAVAGIGRSVGLSVRAASLAALLFFLTPVVLSESTVDYVDLIFTASFLLAFHFVLRFLRSPTFAADGNSSGGPDLCLALLAGISGGICLGTKSLGILYCGVLVILLIVHLSAAMIRRRVSLGAVGASVSLFLVPMATLGSFWYIRTWTRYGNPVYPIRVDLLGWQLFPGLPLGDFLSAPDYVGPWWKEVLSQWHRDQVLWSRPHYYSSDGRPGGFGPVWSYLAAPLLLVFAIQLIRKNLWAIGSFLVPIGIIFLAQPYKWWSRFTLVLLAAGMVGLAYCLDRVPARISTVIKGLTVALVGVGLWFCSARVERTIPASHILDLSTQPGNQRTIGKVAFPSFAWVDEVDRHARIGIDASTVAVGAAPGVKVFYPLYGSHFSHRVYPLAGANATQFRRYLIRTRLSYVMVDGRDRVAAVAAEIARSGCLKEVSFSQDPPTHVYRVLARCRAVRAQ